MPKGDPQAPSTTDGETAQPESPVEEQEIETSAGESETVEPVSVQYLKPEADPFPDEPWPGDKRVLRTKDVAHGGYLRNNKDGTVSWRPTSYLGPDIHATNVQVLIGALP